MLLRNGTLDALDFGRDDWLVEPKIDGIRALVYTPTVGHSHTRIINRAMNDITHQFPDVLAALPSLPRDTVIDGEIACLVGGRPAFERIQTRLQRKGTDGIAAAAEAAPATFLPFDVLRAYGNDVCERTLYHRKHFLGKLFPAPLAYVTTLAEATALHTRLDAAGWEGIVAKAGSSRYLPGIRTSSWLKIKTRRRLTAYVLGVTPGYGKRTNLFGALLLARTAPGGHSLWYCGECGTGWTDAEAATLLATLREHRTYIPLPVHAEIPGNTPVLFYTAPEVRVRIEYQELTNAGIMRVPSFKGVVE